MRAEDGAGDKRLPQGTGLGVGRETMVSCLGWLFVCVTACLILQLLPALVVGAGQHPPIFADTVVLSAPLSHPSPALLSQVKAFVSDTVQRNSLSLCLWLNLVMGFVWLFFDWPSFHWGVIAQKYQNVMVLPPIQELY